MGLAVDIKNMKEEYNGDLIRVERDCTNRFDTMAADLVFKINDTKSAVLEQKIQIDELNDTVGNLKEEMILTKQLVETGVIIAD